MAMPGPGQGENLVVAPEIQFIRTLKHNLHICRNTEIHYLVKLKFLQTLNQNVFKLCDKRVRLVDWTFRSSSPNISSQYLAILYCWGRLKMISDYYSKKFQFISNMFPKYISIIFPIYFQLFLIYFQFILSQYLAILYCCSRLKPISNISSRYLPAEYIAFKSIFPQFSTCTGHKHTIYCYISQKYLFSLLSN